MREEKGRCKKDGKKSGNRMKTGGGKSKEEEKVKEGDAKGGRKRGIQKEKGRRRSKNKRRGKNETGRRK